LEVIGDTLSSSLSPHVEGNAASARSFCLLVQVLICRKKMLPRIGLLHPGQRLVTSACFWFPGTGGGTVSSLMGSE